MSRSVVTNGRSCVRWSLAIAAVFLSFGPALVGFAADAKSTEKTPEQWIAHFSKRWDERSWQGKFATSPDGYIRPMDDAGWKLRVQTLQGLAQHGADAIPVLLHKLKTGDAPQRVLAAQTLGYLGKEVPPAPLLDAAKNDPDPAVRLYAVDSLGMQGAKNIDWMALLESEFNRDVDKHIGYAIERSGEPLDREIIERLTSWDSTKIDTAFVGSPAPDFELKLATGETIGLGDFRGKKAVVLVFVYGDT